MMTEAEIYAILTDIFRDAFADNKMILTPELSARDVQGWDSLKQITIVVATERKFAIRIRSRDLDRMRNVGDLVRTIAERTAGA
jgi:acyl carrier protein